MYFSRQKKNKCWLQIKRQQYLELVYHSTPMAPRFTHKRASQQSAGHSYRQLQAGFCDLSVFVR